MATAISVLSTLSLLAPLSIVAQFQPNYDEAKVPKFELPDPLFADGSKVDSVEAWMQKRRPEIYSLFLTQMFGKAPGKPDSMVFETETEANALDGQAIRKQVTIYPLGKEKPIQFDMLVYLPAQADGPVPLFVGLNFQGNHTIHTDPGIKITSSWVRNNEGLGVQDHQATEESRGGTASRWPVEMILEKGYGLATIYYGDIDPDFDDGFQNGIHPYFYKEGQTKPAADEWGSIAAWAWGLSRALDYFETDAQIDAARVAVIGHSRLGKTSLWAGATDPRFALVISNDSGCGGAALSKRAFGETVGRINTAFPHWFCGHFKQYNENEAALPFDQHMLISLMAPRPVYIASAEEDQWADPRGEFLSGLYASPVYELFGLQGLSVSAMPAVDQPAADGTIAYHIRTGKHDVTAYDWQQYLQFADRFLKK